jgi:hypothetical protein
MKMPKINDTEPAWNDMLEKSPESIRELYIVVQQVEGGERVRNAAYWQQNANGDWGWNKEGITHWIKWPDMPKGM